MRSKVNILREIDVSKHFWCDSAVLFSVRNGKGTLTHHIGREDSDYQYYSQLILNDKPIMQGKYPVCPTCTGMLAVGYGMENIDCPELTAARECLNSEYTNITDVAEMIKPLLGLLDDGYYLLADVPHIPTDSEGNFFYSVPNELTEFSGACDANYNSDFLTAVDGVPMYLYPTQSAELINDQRVEYYTEILRSQPHSLRALAYHEKGFFSALLDGHHKACASARLGMKLNCWTIIPANSCSFAGDYRLSKEKTHLKSVGFADIRIIAPNGMTYSDYIKCRSKRTDVDVEQFKLTGRSFPEEERNIRRNYLTLRSMSIMMSAKLDIDTITEDDISHWLYDLNHGNYGKLCFCLEYWAVYDAEKAVSLAKRIIEADWYELPLKQAWQIIVDNKSPENEHLAISYLVDHEKSDYCWDIVASYWD